jgi:hypothetical protein
MTPTLLRLIIVTLAIAAGAIAPAQAATGRLAPQWLDQTVYRPDCLPADCDCDCRSGRLCLPACVRQ